MKSKKIFSTTLFSLVFLSSIAFIFFLIYNENEQDREITNNHILNQNETPSIGTTNSNSLIAHAGGEISKMRYTNSLEALNHNYRKGFRYFEIDFEWTSDDNLVAIHDWNKSVIRLFEAKPKIYSLSEFENASMINNLTQLSYENITKWIETYPDAYIITDVKSNNTKALEQIFSKNSDIINNIIPQVMSFEEFIFAKELGYTNIILTLYKTNYDTTEIVEFAEKNNVTWVTMHFQEGFSKLPSKLKKVGSSSLVYTLNDKDIANELIKNNISGIYTDSLLPKDLNYSLS